MNSIRIFRLELPLKRPFQWRVWLALVALYFLGNLAGVPLLKRTGVPVEPVWLWGLATLIAAILIALSLVLANHTGLGAPWLEGRLRGDDLHAWLKSGVGLTLLLLVAGSPLSWWLNRDADPATYPFGWELLPASLKAGVVEELAYRFLLMSLFVWVGRTLRRDAEGRPHPSVYWGAILLTGLTFGWAHVDARLGQPTASFGDYALIMLVNSALGIYFGCVLWRLGLEWAMLAHFAFDAFISIFIVPVSMLTSQLGWVVLSLVWVVMLVAGWRMLRHDPRIDQPVT